MKILNYQSLVEIFVVYDKQVSIKFLPLVHKGFLLSLILLTYELFCWLTYADSKNIFNFFPFFRISRNFQHYFSPKIFIFFSLFDDPQKSYVILYYMTCSKTSE